MPIYIFHGTNKVALRNAVIKLHQKFPDNIKTELQLDSATPSQLFDLLNTVSVFGEVPLVIFDITGSTSTQLEKYIPIIETLPTEAQLCIYSEKELPKTHIVSKKTAELKAKTMVFEDFPKSNVFKFLTSVFALNRKASYQELQKLLDEGEDNFYIFSMLIYGVRNLLLEKFSHDKFDALAPFTKNTVKGYTKNFSEYDIKNLINILYKIDKDVKTGNIIPEIMVPLVVEKILCLPLSPKNI